MSSGIGDTLREAREEQGRSIEEAAHALRLRSAQLRALEDEQFDGFGGDVYARGFLKSYALELGLDPAPLLDTYREQVSGEDPVAAAPLMAPGGSSGVRTPRAAPPGWIAWVLVGVLVLAALGFLGQFVGSRAPEVASPEPPVSPVDGDADGEDADGPAEPEPTETEEPEPPAPEGIELFLALEAASWMRVTVDGTVVFEQVAPAGETLRFPGEDSVTVRYGNAGGVRVELNGEDLGAPGAPGSVVEVEYTPDGPSDT
ncbi:helix-turn-helix domain-containing protein [Nitriliruptor alkaliphilus]|uniref:helix-turn-helix domain-containing protein n=1 Tax=Nitriliruptor alkaliphilus TaxID=427918 RepID=UPI000698FA5B|nr:helix-turn-helix domain-containing protein [Nitriliruptor alkaliphilus]